MIEEALADFNVDGVTIAWEPFLENATPKELAKALQRGADLFHFAGHGMFEEQDIEPQTGSRSVREAWY